MGGWVEANYILWWKNINLDSLDGYKYYWYNLREKCLPVNERKYYKWLGECFRTMHRSSLQQILGCMNSEIFQAMLFDHRRPFAPLLGSAEWKIKQDHVFKHTIKSTLEWFIKDNRYCLSWHSQSPDLKTMDNFKCKILC